MRMPIIAGNWKMNLGGAEEALAFVRRIRYRLNEIEGVERVLCPPFTVLAPLAEILRPTRIRLGAQTMHWEERGAYTGEISPSMLAGLCQYVILGHSERRTGRVSSPDPGSAYNFQFSLRASLNNFVVNFSSTSHDQRVKLANIRYELVQISFASICLYAQFFKDSYAITCQVIVQ